MPKPTHQSLVSIITIIPRFQPSLANDAIHLEKPEMKMKVMGFYSFFLLHLAKKL